MWKSQFHKTSTWWVHFGKCLCLPYSLDWKCCFSKRKCVFHNQKKKISNHVCFHISVLLVVSFGQQWVLSFFRDCILCFALLFCSVESASGSTQRRDYCTWSQDVLTGAVPACLSLVCVSVLSAHHLLGHPNPIRQISFFLVFCNHFSHS